MCSEGRLQDSGQQDDSRQSVPRIADGPLMHSRMGEGRPFDRLIGDGCHLEDRLDGRPESQPQENRYFGHPPTETHGHDARQSPNWHLDNRASDQPPDQPTDQSPDYRITTNEDRLLGHRPREVTDGVLCHLPVRDAMFDRFGKRLEVNTDLGEQGLC